MTDKSNIIEQARLDIMAKVAEKRGADLTESEIIEILGKYFTSESIPENLTDLTHELTTKSGGYSVPLSEILEGVTIGIGGQTPGGGEDTTPTTIAEAKPASGGTVTAISNDDTTPLKDDLENVVKVPKGFGIAEDSGTKVEEGIVIEDADSTRDTFGSQFVWVPVGTGIKVSTEISASGTIDIPLGRYVFNTSTGAVDETLSKTQPSDQLKISASSSDYFTEGLTDATTSNTHAKDIATFISRANSNGGYYIARYEAGISGTTSSTTASTLSDGSTSKNSSSAAQIVTKAGVGVWNYINQSNAANVCQSMYNTSSDKVTSDLVNSYAWDTAIVFIQKCRK